MKSPPAVGVRGRLRVLSSSSGLLALLSAIALALTLGALAGAVGGPALPPPIPPGVYFGWTDGVDGRFQVLADACSGPPADANFVASASLTSGARSFEFQPPAIDATPAALTFAAAVPVLSFDPRALRALVSGSPAAVSGAAGDPLTTELTRLTVRCRDYAMHSARLGRAALVTLPGPAVARAASGGEPLVGVTGRRVPPTGDLLGVLVVSNDGDKTIVLRSLRYAPAGASTGRLLAAAGPRELLPAWLGAVLGNVGVPASAASRATASGVSAARPSGARPLAGTIDPATLSPWSAAYQDPDAAGALRERSAGELDLRLSPGDMALIAIGAEALARTVVPRPALLYPVVGYVEDPTGGPSGAAVLGPAVPGPAVPGPAASLSARLDWRGSTTPLFGSTRGWR